MQIKSLEDEVDWRDFLKALKALGEQETELVSYFEESDTASRAKVSAPAKEKLETIPSELGLNTDRDADVAEAAIDKLVTGKGGNNSVNTLQKRLDRLERERKAELEKP